nr:EamA family transporter [Haladaptatus halobius]
MNYVGWAIVALVGYTALPPLVSIATQEIPDTVAALVANGMLVVAALVITVYEGEQIVPYLTSDKAPYMYLAGVFLAVGILAYYRALASGPVSVVVPIFGLLIAMSSILGIAFLDEPLTARKATGIGFTLLAIYLTTVEKEDGKEVRERSDERRDARSSTQSGSNCTNISTSVGTVAQEPQVLTCLIRNPLPTVLLAARQQSLKGSKTS